MHSLHVSISSYIRCCSNLNYCLLSKALSFASREEFIDNMDVDNAPGQEDWEDIPAENAGLYTLPPGEEGMLHSHAGGESIFQQIIEGVDPQ
jgi:hypothetical protein